jgi:AcrR family transcriptional regulator
VPQVKKEHVRDLILEGAFALFEERGYAGTTMRDIAGAAGISASTIYVYFDSKLDILFAIYAPWLSDRLDALEREIATIDDPRRRLRRILDALWDTIPSDNNGFTNNLMQAFSLWTPDEDYDRAMLLTAETRVSKMLRGAIPEDRWWMLEREALAHILFMAFDGFTVNHHLVGRSRRLDLCADLMVDLMLGTEPEPAPA